MDELLEGFRQGLREEIAHLRIVLKSKGLAEPVHAAAGRLLGREGGAGGFVYRWTLPAGAYRVREDDAVQVLTESQIARGLVVAFDFERREIVIACDVYLGTNPHEVDLLFDPTYLLEQCLARIEEIAERPERFHPANALRLFGQHPAATGMGAARSRPGYEGLNEDQRLAIARALGSEVCFVWGPPGTGKTRTLGELVGQMAEDGMRVLVAAHTNAAVDAAAAAIVQAIGPVAVLENQVLRFGVVGGPALGAGIGLDDLVDRRVEGLDARLWEELLDVEEMLYAIDPGLRPRARPQAREERRHQGGARSLALVCHAIARRLPPNEFAQRILARIGEVRGALDRHAQAATREAQVLVTTLARLTTREELFPLRFDAVVCDEASSAPLPYVWYAACLAARKAIALGDWKQLAPIVQARTRAARRWLGRDIFQVAGVAQNGARDTRCAMLRVQHRMHPLIRGLVSAAFYEDLLCDSAEVAAWGEPGGGPRDPLLFVETRSLNPRVARVGGSRINEPHANAVLRLVELALRAGWRDIGVVTPYRGQTKLIRRLLRERLEPPAGGDLEISTVHAFQGREKGMIIFDTVDAPPEASRFLSERWNRELPRLLNVALSRARRQCVIVGCRAGLRRTLPEDALLNRIIDWVAQHGTVVEAHDRLNRLLRSFQV